MSYHDNNYLLQDAISAYLAANLSTYASGVAGSLSHVLGGDFGDRGGNHIYIVCPELDENPDLDGSFTGQIIVGVATRKETTLTVHRSYVKAVVDLMMDSDLPLHVITLATNKLRINQRTGSVKTVLGAISEGLRFSEVRVSYRVYQIP